MLIHKSGKALLVEHQRLHHLRYIVLIAAAQEIFKDPFIYANQEGGGQIVQRFGTPSLYNEYGVSSVRYFGLKSTASYFGSGVHNVFYTKSSQSTAMKGKETISMFVNDQDNKAAAYEFAFSPVEEGSKQDPGDDHVFDVDYVFAKLSFQAQAQGGARTIGNGVFLAMSGADATGLEVADTAGKTHSIAYSNGTHPLYDPFIRVMTASTEVLV